MKNMRSFIFLSLVAGIICTGIFSFIPHGSFWTTDGGNKFIQVENFIRNGSINIAYPAEDIDPEMKFFPYGGHHFFKKDGKIFSFYPFYFPLLSVPFYKFLGFTGLYLIPILSLSFLAGITGLIFGQTGMKKQIFSASLSTILLTPLIFYGLVFWEESIAVLLCSIAVLLCLRNMKREKTSVFFMAGILTGLASVFREESYIFFAALSGGLLLCSRHRKRIFPEAAGFFCVTVPLWTFQYLTWGHPLGAHFRNYAAMGGDVRLSDIVLGKIMNFYVYLFRFTPDPDISQPVYGMLLFPFFAAFFCIFLPHGKMKDSLSRSLIPLGALASLVSAVILLRAPELVFSSLFTQALLTGLPFLIILPFFIQKLWKMKNRAPGFLMVLCGIYCVLTCLTLNRNDIGIIWGARHFLFIMPLLAVLVFASFKYIGHTPLMKYSLLALFLSSALIQVSGLFALKLKKDASERITGRLEKTASEFILTDIFWLPEESAPLFFRKKFMTPPPGGRLYDALLLLKRNGVKNISIVFSNRYRMVADADLRMVMGSVDIRNWEKIENPGVHFMDITLFECSLK